MIDSDPYSLLQGCSKFIFQLQVPRRSYNEPGHNQPGDTRAPARRDQGAAEADRRLPGREPGTRAHAAVPHAADGHGGAREELRVTSAAAQPGGAVD